MVIYFFLITLFCIISRLQINMTLLLSISYGLVWIAAFLH